MSMSSTDIQSYNYNLGTVSDWILIEIIRHTDTQKDIIETSKAVCASVHNPEIFDFFYDRLMYVARKDHEALYSATLNKIYSKGFLTCIRMLDCHTRKLLPINENQNVKSKYRAMFKLLLVKDVVDGLFCRLPKRVMMKIQLAQSDESRNVVITYRKLSIMISPRSHAADLMIGFSIDSTETHKVNNEFECYNYNKFSIELLNSDLHFDVSTNLSSEQDSNDITFENGIVTVLDMNFEF